MSAETAFRAALAAHAPLAALVGTRIAQNAVPQNASLPYVAFTAQHTPDLSLANVVLANGVVFSIECWAHTAAQADAVADAVRAALAAVQVPVTARASTFDPELQLDATVLTAEWWE